MRLTAILTQTEQKRLERSVRQAEKRGRRAWMARIRGLIRPTQGVSTTADTAMGKNMGKNCLTGRIMRLYCQTVGHLGNIG